MSAQRKVPMTRYTGPDELNNLLGERNHRELFQNLAKTECYICKRLFGEHSPQEFNAHALGDVEISLDIAPVTGHSLLHFRGHKCTDCAKCAECRKLLEEQYQQLYGKDQYFIASDECPECTKLFGEHNSQEMKACTGRIIEKRKKV
jgi:hypothetical protein